MPAPAYGDRLPQEFFEASPMIISESETHIVIAFEISKATLQRHRRFLEAMLVAAAPVEPPCCRQTHPSVDRMEHAGDGTDSGQGDA